MVVRLWVPDTHRFRARNWNLAASGASFTASSVAKSVTVSTPFRTLSSVAVLMCVVLSLLVCRLVRSGRHAGGGRNGREVGEPGGFDVEEGAELLLQLGELVGRGERRQPAGDVEYRRQRPISLARIRLERLPLGHL